MRNGTVKCVTARPAGARALLEHLRAAGIDIVLLDADLGGGLGAHCRIDRVAELTAHDAELRESAAEIAALLASEN